MSPYASEPERESIPVGVSACLLGAKVRFDGGHKHDRFIDDNLGRYFRFVPLCPEMAIGMGSPREPIRLVGDPDNPHAVAFNGWPYASFGSRHEGGAHFSFADGHVTFISDLIDMRIYYGITTRDMGEAVPRQFD